MSALSTSSITLTGVSWHAPDGTPILDTLDLTLPPQRTGLVGRNGSGKTTLLRLIAGHLAPRSGQIIVPGKVGYLPQLPDPSPNLTLADLFDAAQPLAALARAEAGLARVEELADMDWTLEARLHAALAELGLADLPLSTPLHRLSGGQRTRAALAALLFRAPQILLLDEPTNHLDHDGRQRVIAALKDWRGAALIASHDRTLLAEMEAMVELSALGARFYGGNYASYRDQRAAELACAEAKLTRSERAVAEAGAAARRAAARKARTDRQGRQQRSTGSQPKLVLNAARARSEKSGGVAARQQAQRLTAAELAQAEARQAVEVLQPLAIDIPPTGLTPGRLVLQVSDLSFAYDGAPPVLRNLSLTLRGPERVAVQGGNGAGKSTLLACISGALPVRSGQVVRPVPMARLDQDMTLFDPAEKVREAFARLDPQASENHRRAVLARFLFRGADALQPIAALSGGQRLRAGLACTLGHSQPRQLLLLDEPDNHLDLEALDALEAALSAYDGALLVVSHDPAFLKRIGITRRIELP